MEDKKLNKLIADVVFSNELFTGDLLLLEEKINNKFFLENYLTSADLDFSTENSYFILFKHNDGSSFIINKIKQESELIVEQFEQVKDPNTIKIHIIEVFDKVKDYYKSIDQDYSKDIRENIKDLFKNEIIREVIPLRNVKYLTVLNPNPKNNQVKISINNRIRSIEKFEDESGLVSFVYVAKIFDIVEHLFSDVGDSLFSRNVRFGLGNQNEVDTAIEKTLDEDPHMFFYYNNGISLYVPKYNQIDRGKYNTIVLDDLMKNPVSIINGAQTISAVAKVLYTSQDEILKNKIKDVEVLLRLFTFKEVSDSSVKTLDKITVSLNRQKPIKIEDIAYTADYVKYINNLNETEIDGIENQFKFTFVRRGDSVSNANLQYNLVDFARIKMAILGDPGKARSQGTATFLRITETNINEIKFVDESGIFCGQNNLSEEENDIKLFVEYFNKYNRPINFSFKLFEKLGNINEIYKELRETKITESTDSEGINTSDNTEKTLAIDSLQKFGKYFLLAVIVKVLNNYQDTYENWSYCQLNGEKLDIKRVIKEFDSFCENEKINQLDSNTFKKKDLFDKFVKKLKEDNFHLDNNETD